MKLLFLIPILLLGACIEVIDPPSEPFAIDEVDNDTVKLGDSFSVMVSGDVSDSADLKLFIATSLAHIDSVRGQWIHATVAGDAYTGVLRLYRGDEAAQGKHTVVVLPGFLEEDSIVQVTIQLDLPMTTRVLKSDGDTIYLQRTMKDVSILIGKFLPASITDSVRFNWASSFGDSTSIAFALRNHRTQDRISGWVKLVKQTKSAGSSWHDEISVRFVDAPWREEEKEYIVEISGAPLAEFVSHLEWTSDHPDMGSGPWSEQLLQVGKLNFGSSARLRFKHRR